jgi:antitoxin ChpS
MHTTNLRKVGGSVMLAIPPAILDILRLAPGATVGMTVDGDRLVVEARSKSHYTLDELLAQCDADAPLSNEERVWDAAKPVGGEII